MASSQFYRAPKREEVKTADKPIIQTLVDEYESDYKSDAVAFLDATPKREMWRYFIDYFSQKGDGKKKPGWLWITESNYLPSLIQAFQVAMTTSINPRSPQFADQIIGLISKLHDKATSKVLNPAKAGHFRHGSVTYGLTKSNSSLAGFREIIEEVKNGNHVLVCSKADSHGVSNDYVITSDLAAIPRFARGLSEEKYILANTLDDETIESLYKYAQGEDSNIMVFSVLNTEDLVKIKLKKLVLQYQEMILSATSPEDKIKAIAFFTLKSLQLHPFADGNCRTISLLLLLFLLKENQLPLTIIDPNVSGGHSIEEWINELTQGMIRGLELAKNKDLPNISTDSILGQASPEEKDNFGKLVDMIEILHQLNKLNLPEEKATNFDRFVKIFKNKFEELIKNPNFTITSAEKDLLNNIIALKNKVLPDEEKISLLKKIIALELIALEKRLKSKRPFFKLFGKIINPLEETYKAVLRNMHPAKQIKRKYNL